MKQKNELTHRVVEIENGFEKYWVIERKSVFVGFLWFKDIDWYKIGKNGSTTIWKFEAFDEAKEECDKLNVVETRKIVHP